MTTIKSYTDISQSKTLSKILPIESVDMHSEAIDVNDDMVFIVVSGLGDKTKSNYGSPVWSLAALLGVLPLVDFTMPQLIGTPKTLYRCMYNNDLKSHSYDNPVDACYEMIIKLHELKLL